MIKEAELHAEEDRKKREQIEAHNQADNIIYATEKALRDYGSKVSESERKNIQDAIDELKRAKEKGDVNEINEKIKKVSEVSQRLGQAVYQEAAKGKAGAQTQKRDKSGQKKGGEDISDAEYKVE